MSDILDTIAANARRRVAARKEGIPLGELRERADALLRGDFRFENALKTGGDIAFICECKKASPSKGLIAPDYDCAETAKSYQRGGAAAISVLTEPDFFQGGDADLQAVRAAVNLPVLRKDFTVDMYQIYESKVLGADAVLLICAILDGAFLREALALCDRLGLSALVETHTAGEIDTALAAGARIVGVNNRDLKTFNVDLGICMALRWRVPEGVLFVAESGITSAEDIRRLREHRVNAALVGETLMRAGDPAGALEALRGAGGTRED